MTSSSNFYFFLCNGTFHICLTELVCQGTVDLFDEVDCVTSNKSTVNSEQSLNSHSKSSTAF